MGITDQEKDNSNSIVITGRDELHSADVLDTDHSGKKRLCVDAKVSVSPGSITFPSMNNNFRVDKDLTEIIYPSPTELYRYDVSDGYLIGFHIDSDTDKLEVQVLIDSVDIFGWISVKNLKDLDFTIGGSAPVLYQGKSIFATKGDDFDFSPSYPISFSSSVVINIRRTDSADVKIKRWFVALVKGA